MSLSYLKSFNPQMQVWGEFYWHIDYSQGFIRRGLIGEALSRVRRDFGNVRDYNFFIVGLYHLFSVTTFGILVLWGARLLGRVEARSACWLLLGLLVFAVSPVVPTQAYNTGYIDIVMMAAALAGAVAAFAGLYVVAILIGLGVALMNEAVLFMWLPVAVLVLGRHPWRQADPGSSALAVLAMGAPFLGIAAILLFEVPGAAARLIGGLHFEPALRDTLINSQYGQSAGGQFRTQVLYLQQFPRAFLITALYTQVPTLLITLLALRLDARTQPERRLFVQPAPWRTLLFLAFAFSPFSLMIFSWDLSRMMAWTNFSAGLLLVLAASCLADAEPAR